MTDTMTLPGQQVLPSYAETVAVLYLPDGTTDEAFNWQTAQCIILDQGARAVAVAPDGGWSVEECQSLYDSEFAAHNDCWGVPPEARP